MKDKNSDIFEGVKNNSKQSVSEDNFFIFKEIYQFESLKNNVSEPSRRLNDYDFNLLEEGAYKDINNELLKLEYKLSKIEIEIKNTQAQIELAYDIQDEILINDLNNRLNLLNVDYNNLLSEYNEKSMSAKITDSITGVFNKRSQIGKNKSKNLLKSIFDYLEKILPSNIKAIIELKQSLTKLENINKSVDELMSLNIPYGENQDKYEQLSKYIIKANSIQTKISQNIKKR